MDDQAAPSKMTKNNKFFFIKSKFAALKKVFADIFFILQIHHCKIDLPLQDLWKVKMVKQRAGHQARQAGQVQTRRQTGM